MARLFDAPTSQQPKLPPWLLLIWLVALAWCAGRWFWLWWPSPIGPALPKSPPVVANSAELANARLFGSVGPEGGQATSANRSGARLVGLNTDSIQGFALIELDGKVNVLKRGETLPDGRKLAAIGAKEATLTRGIQQEILSLSRASH